MLVSETTFGNFTAALAQFHAVKEHSAPPASVFHQTTVPPQFWQVRESGINPSVAQMSPRPPTTRPGGGGGGCGGIASGGSSYLAGSAARSAAERETAVPSTAFDATRLRFAELMFPSAAPTGRDEVFALAKVLDTMLGEVDASPLNAAASSAKAPRRPVPPHKAAKSNESVSSMKSAAASAAATTKPTVRKLMFENGAPPVTLDDRGNEVPPPKEQFDHHRVRAAQRRICDVLMIGWAEVIRQTYAQTAERGVLLEKLRGAFSDLLENAYDIADYFQKRVDDIEALKLDEKIHDLYKLVEKKELECRSLQRRVGELSAEIEKFEPQREELERLRKREAYMNVFLNQQIERNAQLIQLGQILTLSGATGAGGSGFGGGTRSRRSSVASSRYRSTGGGGADGTRDDESAFGGESADGGDPNGDADPDAELDEDGSGDGDEDGDGSQTSSSHRSRNAAIVTADSCVQVEMDRKHDDALYAEVNNMIKHLETVAEASDRLAHKVYGQPDVAKPSYHCSVAIAKLEDLTYRTIAAQEKANISHGNPQVIGAGATVNADPANPIPLPARGALEITKPFLISLSKDASASLKQMAMRLQALLDHKGLQKALTDPMRPPRSINEPCQLCKRVGIEPKMLQAHNDLQVANTDLHKSRREVARLAEECLELKGQVEHLRNSLMNASAAVKRASMRRQSAAAPTAGGSTTSTGDDVTATVTAAAAAGERNPKPSAAATAHEEDVDATYPQLSFADAAVTTSISIPLEIGASGSDGASADAVRRLLSGDGSRSPPLKLELIINCECTTRGHQPHPGEGAAAVDAPPSPTNRRAGGAASPSTAPSPRVKKLSLHQLATMMSPSASTKANLRSATFGNLGGDAAIAGSSPFSFRGAKSTDAAAALAREEKRRSELALRVSRLKDVISMAAEQAAELQGGKSLPWTLKLISNIYKSKSTSDVTHLTERRVPLTCPEHFVDFMKQTYGTKRLVDDQTLYLLMALNKHGDDLRVQQFGMFLHEDFSRDVYCTFVRLNKIIDESLGMFDTVNAHTADDEVRFARIPFECAVYTASQVFRDVRGALRCAIAGALELSAPSVALAPGRTFRSMTVSDFEVLQDVALPPDSNVRDVPRAHWLRHICEILHSGAGADDDVQPTSAGTFARQRATSMVSGGGIASRSRSVSRTPIPSTALTDVGGGASETDASRFSLVDEQQVASQVFDLPTSSSPEGSVPPAGFLFTVRTSDHNQGLSTPTYVASVTPTPTPQPLLDDHS